MLQPIRIKTIHKVTVIKTRIIKLTPISIIYYQLMNNVKILRLQEFGNFVIAKYYFYLGK